MENFFTLGKDTDFNLGKDTDIEVSIGNRIPNQRNSGVGNMDQ